MREILEALRLIVSALDGLNETDRRQVVVLMYQKYVGPVSDVGPLSDAERAALYRARNRVTQSRDETVTENVTKNVTKPSRNSSRSQTSNVVEESPNRSEAKKLVEQRQEPPSNGSSNVGDGNGVVFKIPDSIVAALNKAPILGAAATLRTPSYWQAHVRSCQGVLFAREILNAEAWIRANVHRAPRKNLGRFLHNWLSKARDDMAGGR